MPQKIQSTLIQIGPSLMMWAIERATIEFNLGFKGQLWTLTKRKLEHTTLIRILIQSQITVQVYWVLVILTQFLKYLWYQCEEWTKTNTIFATALPGWFQAIRKKSYLENIIPQISIWPKECASLTFVNPTILHWYDDSTYVQYLE